MRKVVFFDIDGTLVMKNGRIPESTKRAIESLKKENITPVLSTGRAPAMIHKISQELAIYDYISMNGQYVVMDGEVIYDNPIDRDTLHQFSNFTKEQDDGYIFCGSEEIFAGKTINPHSSRYKVLKQLRKFVPSRLQQSYLKRSMKIHPDPVAYTDKNIYQAILQTSFFNEEKYAAQFPMLRFTKSNAYLFDVINHHVSKATGVKQVLDYLGTTVDQSIAFGDHLNDLEMLKYVKTGIAMGNAMADTKQVADKVTAPVNKDGIYRALVELELIPQVVVK